MGAIQGAIHLEAMIKVVSKWTCSCTTLCCIEIYLSRCYILMSGGKGEVFEAAFSSVILYECEGWLEAHLTETLTISSQGD